jgi:hypothetical protein
MVDKDTVREYLDQKTDMAEEQIDEFMQKVDAYVAGDQMAPEAEERVSKVVEETKQWRGG